MKKASYSNDIHAYVDGELSALERADFEAMLVQDSTLREQVCDIRKIKQQMLAHYQQVPVPPLAKKKASSVLQWTAAASIVFFVGVGFFVAYGLGHHSAMQAQSYASGTQTQQNKVVLHIDSNLPQKTSALLKQAQVMLDHNQQLGKQMQLEIVANNDGIELFEKSNPSREAILALMVRYNNLKLIACQRALERRIESGHPVDLIDQVNVDKPAIDVIIEKMQQGWGYKKF